MENRGKEAAERRLAERRRCADIREPEIPKMGMPIVLTNYEKNIELNRQHQALMAASMPPLPALEALKQKTSDHEARVCEVDAKITVLRDRERKYESELAAAKAVGNVDAIMKLTKPDVADAVNALEAIRDQRASEKSISYADVSEAWDDSEPLFTAGMDKAEDVLSTAYEAYLEALRAMTHEENRHYYALTQFATYIDHDNRESFIREMRMRHSKRKAKYLYYPGAEGPTS